MNQFLNWLATYMPTFFGWLDKNKDGTIQKSEIGALAYKFENRIVDGIQRRVLVIDKTVEGEYAAVVVRMLEDLRWLKNQNILIRKNKIKTVALAIEVKDAVNKIDLSSNDD